MNPLLSVIVPCFNEQDCIPLFYQEMNRIAQLLQSDYALDCEMLFVDDGSTDQTCTVLRELAKTDSRVRYLSFSRNFGKEAGIYAGLQAAKGDYLVFVDADLQHPPSMLPEMYEALRSGEYDCAAARRTNRQGEPPVRSFFAHRFYGLMRRISNAELVDGATDFRMMTRQAANAISSMTEYNRFSKGMFSWIGFRTKWLPYENVERAAGSTKWSFLKLLAYSVEGIVAFSTAPLTFVFILGSLLCALSFIMICYIIIKTIIFGDPAAGWPSLMCVIMFMGGLQIFCMGILGEYLGKTYLEAKHRPIYIIRETEEAVLHEKQAP